MFGSKTQNGSISGELSRKGLRQYSPASTQWRDDGSCVTDCGSSGDRIWRLDTICNSRLLGFKKLFLTPSGSLSIIEKPRDSKPVHGPIFHGGPFLRNSGDGGLANSKVARKIASAVFGHLGFRRRTRLRMYLETSVPSLFHTSCWSAVTRELKNACAQSARVMNFLVVFFQFGKNPLGISRAGRVPSIL